MCVYIYIERETERERQRQRQRERIYIEREIKRSIFYVTQMKLTLKFPFYRSFSAFWNIFGGLCTRAFYSWAWARGDVKSSVS